MFIRAYLQASAEDPWADRVKEVLDGFVQAQGHRIASYYRENFASLTSDRPEFARLLAESLPGDILLIDRIDRMIRLTSHDWTRLTNQVTQHGLRILSLDLPATWQMMSAPSDSAVAVAINHTLLDTLAALAQQALQRQRVRQQEGIARAQRLGKFKGKPPDRERHKKVLYCRQVKKMSIQETAQATGYSPSQVCRIQALYRQTDKPLAERE